MWHAFIFVYIYVFYFCHVICVIVIDVTGGGTLGTPTAGYLPASWSLDQRLLCSSFIDCSQRALRPALDSLFDCQLLFRGPQLCRGLPGRYGAPLVERDSFVYLTWLFSYDLLFFLFFYFLFEYQQNPRGNAIISVWAGFWLIPPDICITRMTWSPELEDNDAKKKKKEKEKKSCLCAFKRRDHIVILGLSTGRLWRWTDSGSEGGVCGGEREGVGGACVGVS